MSRLLRVVGTLAMSSCISCMSVVSVIAQTEESVVVELALQRNERQVMYTSSELRPLYENPQLLEGKEPGGLAVAADVSPDLTTAGIRIDTNADGDLNDEVTLLVDGTRDADVQVMRLSGRETPRALPYSVGYRYIDRAIKRHRLIWKPQYRAEGVVHFGECSQTIALFDLDGDGHFGFADSFVGTALGIDRDRNGIFRGRAEWHDTFNPVVICGRRLTISFIAPDGSQLRLTPVPFQ